MTGAHHGAYAAARLRRHANRLWGKGKGAVVSTCMPGHAKRLCPPCGLGLQGWAGGVAHAACPCMSCGGGGGGGSGSGVG